MNTTRESLADWNNPAITTVLGLSIRIWIYFSKDPIRNEILQGKSPSI
jgi:hypothetical protein